jgi:flagellin
MSSSILTNASALTALQALNQTQQNLQTTENQVSTGLAISTAADNAAYWSIGTKMTAQNSALGAVSSALNESGSLLSTMTTALNSTITIMTAIQNDLLSAEQPGADASSIQTSIAAQQQALLSIGASANFNGQNFLDTSAPGTVGLVASYDPTSGVSTINIDTTNTQLFNTASTAATQGILGASGTNYTAASILTLNITTTGVTNGDIQNMLLDVQAAMSSITTASSTLGATTTNVTNQQTFISALSDSLTNGVGSLVDADMNEASTRLSALQVQQQLGIQALSIANSNTQLILKLFGG